MNLKIQHIYMKNIQITKKMFEINHGSMGKVWFNSENTF